MTARLICLFTCLPILLFGTVQASAFETCQEFSTLYEIEEVKVTDNPPSGPSVGDIRTARSQLMDDQGKEVGVIFYHATAMPQQAGGTDDSFPLLAHGHVVLPTGTIAATGIFGREISSRNVLSEELSYAVLGGTGAFANATGEIVATKDDETAKRRFTFRISCPG